MFLGMENLLCCVGSGKYRIVVVLVVFVKIGEKLGCIFLGFVWWGSFWVGK